MTKGKREILVKPERGEPRKYSIPRGKHIIVHEGDYVKAGEPLMDGPVNPHDVLRINGIKALQRYLVDEIQEVYQLQGVKINDKHIEMIVRQMLKRVRIKDVGDTNFIIDEPVEWWVFEEENRRVMEQERAKGRSGVAIPGYHEGFAHHGQLHIRGELPGYDEGAHPGFNRGSHRLPARPERECNHGEDHPSGHGILEV